MTEKEILRHKVDEKIKMLNHFRESVVSTFNNNVNHTDDEVLNFFNYIDYLDNEIAAVNTMKMFTDLID